VALAREATSPSDVHGMVGAAGIVTTLGGPASHAAVVARSWAIPAVTSLAGARVLATGLQIGDRFIADGEVVTVDGTAGALYTGDQREGGAADPAELRVLRDWAAELGLELGTAVVAPSDPGRDADVTLLELARTVHLKGLCTPERAAAVLAAALPRIEDLVTGHESLFRPTPRGVALTPEGRSWLTDQLAVERDRIDQAALDACYESFMALNHRFKQVVSEWQLAADEPTASDWEALVDAVAGIHTGLEPLLARTAGSVARLAGYARRFDQALSALRRGDRSMLASPLKDSYHQVWFEYHEELITLTGRDRAAEEARDGDAPPAGQPPVQP
jgi:pyruvate,orthophosphate dikinase